MSHNQAATFTYLFDNFRATWDAMVELNAHHEEHLQDLVDNPSIRAALFFDGLTEEQYAERIKMGYVAVAACFPDTVVMDIMEKHPDATIISAMYAVEKAALGNLLNHDFTFPICVNVAAAVSLEHSPKDPSSAYDDVFAFLELGDHITSFIKTNVEVTSPRIH